MVLWVVWALLGALIEAVALVTRQFPPLTRVVRRLYRRVGWPLLALWAWLTIHFFVQD